MRNVLDLASLALLLPGLAQATFPSYHQRVGRQAAAICPTLPSSSGGRKIGIVVDSSGSNSATDPNRLRVAAAKQLNAALVTSAQAGAGGTPDQVTAVDFDSSASVIYPLGDPSGATVTFDSIDESGGTFIAGGLKAAIDEITKPAAGPTAGRSGIVVFTDGEDSSLTTLINEVNRAGGLGIRVSFGFLSPTTPAGASALLNAIMSTGGVYSTITTAAAQQAFVNQVISRGLTNNDAGTGPAVLFPGLATAGQVSSASPKTFTYSATAGEKLDFTVTALGGKSLDVVLRDTKASSDISTAKTDAKGVALIKYEAKTAIDLGLVVSTVDSGDVLFTVGLNSSLGANYSNPCIPPPTNTTGPKTNTTSPPYATNKTVTSTVYVCPTCPPTVLVYPCPVCPPVYKTQACSSCAVVTATAACPTCYPGYTAPTAVKTASPSYSAVVYTTNGAVVTASPSYSPVVYTTNGAVITAVPTGTVTGGPIQYTGAAVREAMKPVLAGVAAVAAVAFI
ncbi:MAG: hypothetical protein M1814_005403 [Vezdaea aestivalis]|nr:MAG: hypothetical protein M1814_005403 [Vezdaea aestivalis]